METCPKCGVPRECKVWRCCTCGYDFEPGYVHVADKPAESTGENDALHWWGYFIRYLATRAALILCIVVTSYLGRFEWLAWVLFISLEIWLWSAMKQRARGTTGNALRSRT